MTYFVIAGEASGDLHASKLIEHLRLLDTDAVFSGLGGDKMQAAGCKLVQHYREMAYMGVVAVMKNLGKVRRNLQLTREALLEQKPDVLILIDYPTFNLQIARFCRQHLPTTKIYYYIPPKIWAWKQWRVRQIRRYVDHVFCIFPFEPEFYARHACQATYVGNPTAAEVSDFRLSAQNPALSESATRHQQMIALLPGSRREEIRHCLPVMLAAAAKFEQYEVCIAMAPAVERSLYDKTIALTQKKYHLPLINYRFTTDTFLLLSEASAAVVNSGTATLEAALLGCPQVAVYHLACSRLLEVIRPLIFKIRYFTLPNICLGKQVICELLGYHFTPEAVCEQLTILLTDIDYRQRMLANYKKLRHRLGTNDAAETTAAFIYSKK